MVGGLESETDLDFSTAISLTHVTPGDFWRAWGQEKEESVIMETSLRAYYKSHCLFFPPNTHLT